MSQYEDTVKLPTANISLIERWQAKFEEVMIPAFVAEEIAGENYAVLTNLITDMVAKSVNIELPYEVDNVNPIKIREAMAQTVNNFLGKRIPAPQTLKAFAGVLAGNLTAIKVGKVLQPWCGLDDDEWHAAQVVAARRYVTPKKKISGSLFTYRIITGPAASLTVDAFVSRGAMYTMAKRLGVMAKDEFRLLHPREMVGIYSMVLLAKGDDLKIKQYYEKQSLAKRNKLLTAERAKARTACSTPAKGAGCHFCQMGVVACPLATHADTYELKQCTNKHTGWMDKDKDAGICLACEQKLWWIKRGQ